ncbi:aromatic acid exporter family protein [Brevibacillus sp. 7WMA2]|uniref:Putative membrane protein n=1 Tax=Brevibacillus laterosporus LMG 15441 TaxID=1042163 RepID=A0A075R8X1_BRELA|nr:MULTISPECIES: aromatic acid exporter family protein [Brevibacillus]HAS01001.1 aromatic acid exporter family protein [Brevibacillus sp.]AIG28294.1 putative membrane protein [Brevibacillus laterosporus LMG 15441]AUM66662.1 aromatic acid exporter family protein [Brevibacillus laterosporus]MBA4532433.1 aromatic acid exporter family protein [Brevibacillus halotolerans]MCR8965299.1 aromatic acid exporter family protein [Brevibacillus laterosporus]
MPYIGYRTLKTAIGAGLSIFLAQLLGLEFYASAGTLTILCIQITRKRSLSVSIDRFIACLVAMVFSLLFFKWVGFHAFTITMMMLIFIPTLVRLRVIEGFISSCVIMLHIYLKQDLSWSFLWNELQLVTIGIGMGLLMNLYMPNKDKELWELQQKVEKNFSVILKELAGYLRHGEDGWPGSEMVETPVLIKKAKELSLLIVENNLLRPESTIYRYFGIREKQFDILERMLPIVSGLSLQVPQGKQIADFLDELSVKIHPGNTSYVYLDGIREIRERVRQEPLPVTREEFEVRASLFYLLSEIEQYLLLKHNYIRSERELERMHARLKVGKAKAKAKQKE